MNVLQIVATTNHSTLAMIYSLTPERDLVEEVLINGRSGGGPLVAKRQR